MFVGVSNCKFHEVNQSDFDMYKIFLFQIEISSCAINRFLLSTGTVLKQLLQRTLKKCVP